VTVTVDPVSKIKRAYQAWTDLGVKRRKQDDEEKETETTTLEVNGI
jgi:hypothetical protein